MGGDAYLTFETREECEIRVIDKVLKVYVRRHQRAVPGGIVDVERMTVIVRKIALICTVLVLRHSVSNFRYAVSFQSKRPKHIRKAVCGHLHVWLNMEHVHICKGQGQALARILPARIRSQLHNDINGMPSQQ